MPPQYKTCSTVVQRQALDTGQGRIFVPSSFGGGDNNRSNDSCGEVKVHDCPTGYKSLHSSHTPKKGYVNDTVRLSGSDLNRHKCWEGGHYHGTGGQAPWGTNHGLNHTYASNSKDSGWGDEDNFGRPCFKDTSGWTRTNPLNGNKSGVNTEDNITSCCGFKDSVRGTVQEKYCNPDYCFNKNSTKYSISNPDEITKKCADHLVNLCGKWSFVDDLIGFEDDRCSDPIGQISKDTGKHRDNLTDHHLAKEVKYPASIQRSEYSKIGNDLCMTDDFLNSGSRNAIKQKKNKKCLQWCQDNSDVCAGKMTEVCQAVYDRVIKFPDVFPDDLKKFEGICACNWPKEFYDNIIEYYIKTYNVSAAAVGTRRKCLFRPCGSSNIKHVDPTASDSACPQTNFTSCIQNLNIDFTGSQIEGEVNVDAGQSQSCGTLADSGAGGGGGDTDNGGGGADGGGEVTDNTPMIVSITMFALIIIALIAGGVIIIKK